MELEIAQYILVALAALLAGAINALAGGGTLITFPTLIALGLPSVVSNMTNTVALLPGYIGGTLAQKKDLAGQEKRLWFAIPAGLIGGLIGGYLLFITGEKIFRQLVPFLILLASLLLAIQDPVRAWMNKRAAHMSQNLPKNSKCPSCGANIKPTSIQCEHCGTYLTNTHDGKIPEGWAALPVGLAAIYGGYFGAGLSVIILAALGFVLDDSITRLNAIKQAIAFSANVAAAAFFVFSSPINWPVALVMMVGALIGGSLGGRLAGRIKPATLRYMVVGIGVVLSIIYFIRG